VPPGRHLKKSLHRSESVPERVRPAFMGYSETIGICPEVALGEACGHLPEARLWPVSE
jgi:hypothetical protein